MSTPSSQQNQSVGSNQIAGRAPAAPATQWAPTPLNAEQVENAWRIVEDVKALLPDVPLAAAAVVNEALREVVSQLGADRPNATVVATGLRLISTLIQQSQPTEAQSQVSKQIHQFTKNEGEEHHV